MGGHPRSIELLVKAANNTVSLDQPLHEVPFDKLLQACDSVAQELSFKTVPLNVLVPIIRASVMHSAINGNDFVVIPTDGVSGMTWSQAQNNGLFTVEEGMP